MKTRLIIAIAILCSALMGCVHPVVTIVNERTDRISSLTQNARDNFEECLARKDKKENDLSVCEDVEQNLLEIINTSNELSGAIKGML